jgi:hypothetical protein
LSNIFDNDDINQSLELYRLYGYSEEIVEKIVALQIERNERVVCQRSLGENKYRSGLSCILYPENDKLLSIPAYDRYVAWCISHYGVRNAAKHLGFSRMSFYRWLDKNGYKHKFTR